jgi:hypothetical protein
MPAGNVSQPIRSEVRECSELEPMYRFTIPVLRLLTAVLNGLTRFAHNHPRIIIEIFLMLAAAIVVSVITALFYIVWLIHGIAI